jgi:nucleotide-binding universal stress UspA family protein
MGRILLATDGTPATRAAERKAAELAARLGVGLTLLYVVEPPVFSDVVFPLTALLARHEGWASELLRDRAQVLRQEGLDVETQVATGDPSDQILRQARDPDVAMVVIGASGSTTRLSGSVASRLSPQCPRPLLIVRSDAPLTASAP